MAKSVVTDVRGHAAHPSKSAPRPIAPPVRRLPGTTTPPRRSGGGSSSSLSSLPRRSDAGDAQAYRIVARLFLFMWCIPLLLGSDNEDEELQYHSSSDDHHEEETNDDGARAPQ